jgi:hypothetical protein
MLNRRQFVGGTAAAVLSGSRVLGQDAGAATKYPAGRYVDMHTHLGQTWNSRELTSSATGRAECGPA